MYLLENLRYWFWDLEDEPKAQNYADQLALLLNDLDPHGTTVRGAEGRALIMASRCQWQECLLSKRHQIDMVRHLLAEPVDPDVMDGEDLVIAAEEYFLFARAAGELPSADLLVAELLRDGMLEPKQEAFLKELLSEA